MANLPESATYDAGVYQLETTDAVVGGAAGKSNAAAINLANRTAYLKAHVDSMESVVPQAEAEAGIATTLRGWTAQRVAQAAAVAAKGRLLRTTIYTLIAGVQNISVDGSAPTTTGAGTFTPLAATTAIIAEVSGGGGGCGGLPATTAGQQAMGTGGGGGAYGSGYYTSGFSGATITVGAAGTAGASNGAAGNGGTSSVGAILSASGGIGSAAGAINTGAYNTGYSAGGSTISGANMLAINGGQSGQLLSSALGYANGNTGGENAIGGSVGYGAGSPGIYSNISTAAKVGTAGKAGIVIIREYA